MNDSYSILGGKSGQIAGDWFTLNGLPEATDTQDGKKPKTGYSWKTTHYIRMLTEGKSWTQIVTYLNQNQFIPKERTTPETPGLYKYHTY